MSKSRIRRAAIAAVPSVLLLFAYETGPDPRHTAAPGDDRLACTTSGCHNTFALGVGGGNVAIQFPSGLTYTPGVAQTLQITITDATARAFGFQLTARLESNPANGQAGDFTAGANQIVICEDNTAKRATGCPANAPIQFIEHGPAPFRTNTITVAWTPPATNVGPVHLYIAANAANGDRTNTGDHIYIADYLLTPQAAGDPPSITRVISASGFNADAGLASGTWLEIYGANFMSGAGRSWAGSDFNGSRAPTALDGISVTVNGIPAYVAYISPGQVNVQAPDDAAIGPNIPVRVTTAGGTSNAMMIEKKAIAPALLAPDSFKVGGKQYVVALTSDQAFVGPAGLITGVNFRPARPGETINLFGIGFGPVSPATAAGTVAAGLTSVQPAPVFRFGSTTATASYAGLGPGFVGLYQFNIVVPQMAPGEYALTADVGGVSANTGLIVTVGQ
jgi:uncharacterized protein (TIGR03437 family)